MLSQTSYASIIFWDYISQLKVHHKTIKLLGYVDYLAKEHKDPIAHFRAIVKEMSKSAALGKEPVRFEIDSQEKLTESLANRKNIGYAVLSKLYHELYLQIFFYNHSRSYKSEFNTNNIMKMLFFSRILAPASKEKTYDAKECYAKKKISTAIT